MRMLKEEEKDFGLQSREAEALKKHTEAIISELKEKVEALKKDILDAMRPEGQRGGE